MKPSDRLLRERSTRSAVAGRPCRDVTEAVARTTAIQAQDTAASYLGVRARLDGATEVDVKRAVGHERSVVRTWLMRGTIHLVETADVRWLVRLIGPTVQRRYRTRWRSIGLTDEVLDASLTALPHVLADGPLDRHAIAAALAEHGIALDGSDPQAPTHLLVHASTNGLICRGPDHGRTSTFALLDQWIPDAPAGPVGDDALAELARRYFAAYSPATAADFTAWSGLPAARAIGLVRDELTETDVDGRAGYRLGEAEPVRGIRLLPAFDNYLLGYRNRTAIVDPSRHGEVYRGGMIRPVVLADGAAIGTWKLERDTTPAPLRITVSPWRELRRAESAAVLAESADVGRFLDREVEVSFDSGAQMPRTRSS